MFFRTHFISGRRIFALLLLALSMTGVSQEPISPEIANLLNVAKAGDGKAQISLGMRYRDGKGVPRNHREAVKWYRMAADQGDAEGLDNVGFMYLRGWGVPKNSTIATAYFSASAAEGHAQGFFNLGNSYFSGQGVEQNYHQAIEAWRQAAEVGHENAIWRLAVLSAAGEGIPEDAKRAEELCRRIAPRGHANANLLLGELLWKKGSQDLAKESWSLAKRTGSRQGGALLELSEWRAQKPEKGSFAFVEVSHLYQGWNNCGATSIAMFARHLGVDINPYAVKRLCPRSPIGTGTDWADLLEAARQLGQAWELKTFSHDEKGFSEGTQYIRDHLDAGQPVVIDFTITREENGEVLRNGHTLLVVGYRADRDQYIVKNPNQPPPGIEIMSTKELESSWYSRGYSRLGKGKSARPLIVKALPDGR